VPVPPTSGAVQRRGAAYLRQYRAQPRRGLRAGALVLLLALAALLFLKVWERTQANALSMERDHLVREVRALENRIQLSTELADQAALREGLSFAALKERGFESPDPSRVVEIDLATRAGAPSGGGTMGARVARALRRIAPGGTTGNGAEMPAAVAAGIVP
jgi:hypothetical protein